MAEPFQPQLSLAGGRAAMSVSMPRYPCTSGTPGTIDALDNYKLYTTGGKGSFGSRNDEERSEMRNVA